MLNAVISAFEIKTQLSVFPLALHIIMKELALPTEKTCFTEFRFSYCWNGD